MAVAPGPEVEEVEASRAEKLLAVGLVVFLLIGGFWVTNRLGSLLEYPDYTVIAARHGLPDLELAYREAEANLWRAMEAAEQARAAMEQARSEYEFRREEYRVALERGLDDPRLAAAHEAARTAYESARTALDLTNAVRASLEAKAAGPRRAYEAACQEAQKEYERAVDRYQLILFGLRFGYALPLFALSVWAWLHLRRRRSRHLTLGTAFLAFAGIQAAALVFQYGWYLLRDIGPLALSVSGSAICIAGLAALRRWATSSKRLAAARLRRGQCPSCGYPLAGSGAYCAGCGRGLAAPCQACGRDVVPQSGFCPHCGAEQAWPSAGV